MTDQMLDIAPGAIVVVRDEQWLVSSVDHTADGELLTVRGVSELVEGTTAQFYTSIDKVTTTDPANTRVVADESSHYVKSRLWLESTLRKTSLPISESRPVMVSTALADPLSYQREAVEKALEPTRLRTRLLIADAVGLGKTLEIGMILSELIRRGRGRRILIVTPRHVLEQMQHEMWTRFAIPFVRLDSEGVQQVKQKLPATRNPFTFFEKVIISIDTLKQDRFIHDLRRHHWDAVVIDESHNVTNQSTQNNQLAHTLAPNTDALILASATPHNGRNESFAQLLNLLEPTSVGADGKISQGAVKNLMIRRHRYSDSVKNEVGDKWAERKDPRHIAVEPSPEELAVGEEIAATWTHPMGSAPVTGKGSKLFPWTLAKAFLSSPVALEATISARLNTIEENQAAGAEREALERLRELNNACLPQDDSAPRSGKYRELVAQLKSKQIGPRSPERAVVFAERVPTLEWLRANLTRDLKLKADQVRILHGGLTDVEQQEIVESFKQSQSPTRSRAMSPRKASTFTSSATNSSTSTSPGPSSALNNATAVSTATARSIRRRSPRSSSTWTVWTALPATCVFSPAWLSASAKRTRNSVIRPLSWDENDDAARATDITPVASSTQTVGTGLFDSDVEYLLSGLTELYGEPGREREGGGVALRVERNNADQLQTVSFEPSEDLRQRLMALPQSYLEERRVLDRMQLTPDRITADSRLAAALNDTHGTSWPDTHYLSPLHPVLDWLADRSLAHLGREEIFAVQGNVTSPTVVVQGVVTNKRGQNISVAHLTVAFMGELPLPSSYENEAEMFNALELGPETIGVPVRDPEQYQRLIPSAVESARGYVNSQVAGSARHLAQVQADAWVERMDQWERSAQGVGAQTQLFRQSRSAVEAERRLAKEMLPDRTYVRPLLVVVPAEGE